MRMSVSIIAALLALGGCGDPAHGPTGQVRLAAVSGAPAAGYFEVPIDGDYGALISVSSSQAGRIEMHETVTSGTMTGMRMIARVPVRDGEVLRFVRGGRHLMLYDVDPRLRAGDHILLTLIFERAAPVPLEAVVTAPGGG